MLKKVKSWPAGRYLSIFGWFVAFFAIVSFPVVAEAINYANGGHMHFHTFACYSRWETICGEDHVHFTNCYRGKGELRCNMEEGRYYTVAEMETLKKDIFVTTVLGCRTPEHVHTPDCVRSKAFGSPAFVEYVLPWDDLPEPQDGVWFASLHKSVFDVGYNADATDVGPFICFYEEHRHTAECYEDVYLVRYDG